MTETCTGRQASLLLRCAQSARRRRLGRPMANVRPKRAAPSPRARDDVRDWLMQMGYPEEVASDVSDKVANIVPATAPLPDRIREAMHHLPQEN